MLESWERDRCVEHKSTAGQHARTLEMLQRQSAAGKEEQLEAVSFLQQRATADQQYAQSISKQKLGGRPVSELSNLRGTVSSSKADGQGGAADASALIDVSGVVAVSAIMSVLGSMMVQAGDRFHKFAGGPTSPASCRRALHPARLSTRTAPVCGPGPC